MHVRVWVWVKDRFSGPGQNVRAAAVAFGLIPVSEATSRMALWVNCKQALTSKLTRRRQRRDRSPMALSVTFLRPASFKDVSLVQCLPMDCTLVSEACVIQETSKLSRLRQDRARARKPLSVIESHLWSVRNMCERACIL